MNELTKTLAFVAAAVALGIVAAVTRPKLDFEKGADDTGTLFYPEFKDVTAANSLELIRFDEATGDPKPFKVAKIDGRWVLPSHENYPADADKKIGQAAASLIDLKKLGIASKSKADHEKLGVVDPSKAQPGAKGTGLLATLADAGGRTLASFIIGNELADDPKQRFVRVPGQDRVYRVTVNPSALSSKFEDWIEKDLLKLNSWDLKQVVLNNYSIDPLRQRMKQDGIVDVTYDDKESKWTLKELKDGEEVNPEPLNQMKQALDDLKIVDVRRKPAGLSHELRSAEGKLDQAAIESLASKGYFLSQDGDLLSNEGEAIARMKDGVTYVLRFGEITGETSPVEPGKEGEDKPAGSNRYLFVMAQFDPELIERPMLEPLPGEPAASEPAPSEPASTEPAASEPASSEPAQSPEAPAADSGQDGDGAADAQEAQPPAADAQAQPAATPIAEPAEKPAEEDPLAAERARIEQENKRKQDEYQKKIEEGQKRVKELNDRFADWYYVISDDVYKKIRLSRSSVVKATGAPPTNEGGAVKQFQDLGAEGIEAPSNP